MIRTELSRRAGRGWRRRLLVAAGVSALAVSAAACGDGGSTTSVDPDKVDTVLELPDLEGEEVVVTLLGGGSYAEALERNVIKPFEERTGASVTVNTNCCDNFETAVEQGQFIGDLTMGNDYGPEQAWSEAGLLTSDPRLAEIGEARGIDPSLYQEDLVAVYFYAYVLAWNTEHADDHPANWEEFFDTDRFTGTRGLFSLPFGDLEIAALADGASADDLFPVDIDSSIAEDRRAARRRHGQLLGGRRRSSEPAWIR